MTSRSADEMTLAWLRERDAGLTSQQVAGRYGVTSERVRTATSRVVKADMESGDDLTGFYPWFSNTRVRAAP